MKVRIIDLVLTTLNWQLSKSTESRGLMRNCISDIAKDIAAEAPYVLVDERMVNWLEIEITREEYSLCEDVLDGSSN